MGEYIRNIHTDEIVKVGVMDRCFFSRQQIKQWHDNPCWVGWYAGEEEKGTLESYLNNPGSLYEKIVGLQHNNFAIKISLETVETIEHKEVYVWHKGKRGSGYQYKVECQFNGKREVWASIVGERYDKEGWARTIFACDCCGVWFSLPEEALKKALENINESDRSYLKPILKAIGGGQ